MTDLDPQAIRTALATSRLGSRLVVLAQTASTMDTVAAMAQEGAPEGTVVIADEQTAGRGRLGRAWVAAPGTSLLLSVLFRPPLSPERGGQVPMAVALGAVDALAHHLPAASPAELKWPNDVLAGGRKIGGLLAEARWTPGSPGEVVVGLGLNVRQSAEDLPPGAASFVALGLTPPERSLLAAELLNATDRYYDALLAGSSLIEDWSARLATLGQDITAHGPMRTVHGRALRVTADGALVVQTGDGETVTLHAADVTVRASETSER